LTDNDLMVCIPKNVLYAVFLAGVSLQVCLGEPTQTKQVRNTVRAPAGLGKLLTKVPGKKRFTSEELEPALNRTNRSNFEKLGEIFQTGWPFHLDKWSRDLALSGKCVRQGAAENFVGSVLNVYFFLRHQYKLNTYFIPTFQDTNPADFIASINQPKDFHDLKAQGLRDHDAGEGAFPSEAPLSEMLNKSLRNTFFFAIREERSVAASSSEAAQIYYGLRIVQRANQKPIAMLEEVCSNVGGCPVKVNGNKMILRYGQPTAFCYYNRPLDLRFEKTSKGRDGR
jgi:hypothetical protein